MFVTLGLLTTTCPDKSKQHRTLVKAWTARGERGREREREGERGRERERERERERGREREREGEKELCLTINLAKKNLKPILGRVKGKERGRE